MTSKTDPLLDSLERLTQKDTLVKEKIYLQWMIINLLKSDQNLLKLCIRETPILGILNKHWMSFIVYLYLQLTIFTLVSIISNQFTVNFAKFLRTPFLQNISGRLLLSTIIRWTVYSKYCIISKLSLTVIVSSKLFHSQLIDFPNNFNCYSSQFLPINYRSFSLNSSLSTFRFFLINICLTKNEFY